MTRLAFAIFAVSTAAVAGQGGVYAILDFDYQGPNPQNAYLGPAARDLLETVLPRNYRVSLVSRTAIDKVLAEQAFGQTGALDPKAAARVGNLLGADGLVLGSVIEAGDELRLAARVIDCSTGKIALTEQTAGKTTEFFGLIDQIASVVGPRLQSQRVVEQGSRAQANTVLSRLSRAVSAMSVKFADADWPTVLSQLDEHPNYDASARTITITGVSALSTGVDDALRRAEVAARVDAYTTLASLLPVQSESTTRGDTVIVSLPSDDIPGDDATALASLVLGAKESGRRFSADGKTVECDIVFPVPESGEWPVRLADSLAADLDGDGIMEGVGLSAGGSLIVLRVAVEEGGPPFRAYPLVSLAREMSVVGGRATYDSTSFTRPVAIALYNAGERSFLVAAAEVVEVVNFEYTRGSVSLFVCSLADGGIEVVSEQRIGDEYRGLAVRDGDPPMIVLSGAHDKYGIAVFPRGG